MTTFTDKDIESLRQCPKCGKYTNIIIKEKGYWCWHCNNTWKEENDD